jgi:hypothetical protein
LHSYNADATAFDETLLHMQSYWRDAELDALYGLSLAEERRARPLPAKLKQRADTIISRNLSRTTLRTVAMIKWLEAGVEPRYLITDVLARIARTEACWRKMLQLLRTVPVIPDPAFMPYRVSSPNDLPEWLIRLATWARPETEIIDDLKQSIATQEPRADEALDHVQWGAEDDIDAMDTVLRRAETWALPAEQYAHLAKASEAARTQLLALIALVEKARAFSMQMYSAQLFADIAKSEGDMPN